MDDLQKRISASRKMILDQRIQPKTLLGKSIFSSLDAAELAHRRGDAAQVQQELNHIHSLLMQGA